MPSKIWELKPPIPSKIAKRFVGYPYFISQLFYNRGLKTPKEAEKFLEPDYEDLYSPFLLKDAKKAIQRIWKAKDRGEKIAIWGDFDVDGLTSTALLKDALAKIGLQAICWIPEKEKEGYGLNKEGILELASKKINLIIAVDCGVSALKEVEEAKKLGIEIIIVDHHQVPKKLPSALAIINPKQKGDQYPFKELAGVGLVFKLVYGLYEEIYGQKSREVEQLKWYLDLVALGTLADLVPLVSENRILSKWGLFVLSKTRRLGLLALYQKASVDYHRISDFEVNFKIIPRLNAAGRLGEAYTPLKLLLSEDLGEAMELVERIEDLNTKRQLLTERIIKEAKEKLGEVTDEDKILMVIGEDWPQGILGVVASRLKEEYNRPVLVLSNKNGIHKGSIRSIDGFNIIEVLDSLGDVLIQFGGHARAAGLSLPEEQSESFYKKLEKAISQKVDLTKMKPKIEIDCEINLDDFTWETLDFLEKFKPFGLENPNPIFLVRGVKVLESSFVGNGKQHLRMQLAGEKSSYKALGFGMSREQVKAGDVVDCIFHLEKDEWNGHIGMFLRILDFRKQIV